MKHFYTAMSAVVMAALLLTPPTLASASPTPPTTTPATTAPTTATTTAPPSSTATRSPVSTTAPTTPAASPTKIKSVDTRPKLPAGVNYLPYSTLLAMTKAGQLQEAIIDGKNKVILYTDVSGAQHATIIDPKDMTTISNMLISQDVFVSQGSIHQTSPPFNWSLLRNLALILAVSAIGVYFYRRKKYGPALKSKKVAGAVEIPTTRFSDVAGADEAVADLHEFVQFFSSPERFEEVGAQIPKGALLCGPPGTGKTLLARAVAGEAGVAFFAASGADFVEIFVGTGAKRVRELFAKARKAERAIVFIDEIDAMAKKRSSGDHDNGGAAEHDSTLIALLNEMDGFHGSNIIVLTATNRPDVLDPAILRPGRLDRRVEVPLPDRRGREKILSIHAATRPVADDVDFESLARRTSGMSGAELASVVNEAAIEAARDGAKIVSAECFEHAVALVSMGRARHSAIVTEQDREVTAWHEAGHTVCAYVQEAADKPVSVSIIPRGPAGGVTWMSEGDELFMKRSKAKARLVTALGGRAAEEMLLGDDYTQGAYGDLLQATELATNMSARFGMTDLGLTVRDPTHFSLGSSALHDQVEALLNEALCTARQLLSEHRDFLEAVVVALLDNDTLDATDIECLYKQLPLPPSQKKPPRELNVVSAPVPAPAKNKAPKSTRPSEEPGGPSDSRPLKDKLLRRRKVSATGTE